MSCEFFLQWREPLVPDWTRNARALLSALVEGGEDEAVMAQRLRRLGGMRLGSGERERARKLTRAALKRGGLPGFRPFRVLLVSNRTLSFLAADIAAAGLARSMLIEVVETGFDAVASLAFNPRQQVPEGTYDAVFVLLDSDFFSAGDALLDAAAEAASLSEAAGRLSHIVSTLRAKAEAPVVLANLATPMDGAQASSDMANFGSELRRVQHINAAIADLASQRACTPFDLATLAAQIGAVAFFDPIRMHQAKLPFSLEATPVVADRLCAVLAAMAGRSARALVLDLDNTLWGGVVADDGLAGIALGQGSAVGESFLAFQRWVLAMRSRGTVLAVCSKNLDEVAREPFQRHPEMLIKEKDVAVFVANFDDKGSNIQRIAKTLDLDPSSLVFVDDNPAERERVRATLPFVYVPEVGEDPAQYVRILVSSGILDHLPLSADDVGRAATYQARSAALALRETLGDYNEYLASLEMKLTIAPFDEMGRARIAQLFQKSNQFNLTTRRYSEVDVAGIEADAGRLGWQVRLKDRFADHGMISCAVVLRGEKIWQIENWIMSCRVLERGVEQAMMAQLVAQAKAAGAERLEGCYLPTARNALVKAFYPRLGFELVETLEDGGARYALVLDAASITIPPMEVSAP